LRRSTFKRDNRGDQIIRLTSKRHFSQFCVTQGPRDKQPTEQKLFQPGSLRSDRECLGSRVMDIPQCIGAGLAKLSRKAQRDDILARDIYSEIDITHPTIISSCDYPYQASRGRTNGSKGNQFAYHCHLLRVLFLAAFCTPSLALV
jgi:hypothetical protein